jgi:hypothetical protein
MCLYQNLFSVFTDMKYDYTTKIMISLLFYGFGYANYKIMSNTKATTTITKIENNKSYIVKYHTYIGIPLSIFIMLLASYSSFVFSFTSIAGIWMSVGNILSRFLTYTEVIPIENDISNNDCPKNDISNNDSPKNDCPKNDCPKNEDSKEDSNKQKIE